MPAAPASFDVKFDLSGSPKLVLTDTSGWTVLEKPNVTGYFSIILPDGIERVVDFLTPDILYSGSDLTVFEYALRLDAAQKHQRGVYTIRYHTDHPSYTPGTFTRTFNFSYEELSELTLTEDFDVFTPSLFYRDETDYAKANYSITDNIVAWGATIGSVGSKTGSASDFDLSFGGNYYDAVYTITFQRNLTYQHTTYSWLTVLEQYSDTINTTADTPPSLTALIACLNHLKTQLDAAEGSCTTYDELKARYEYAAALHHHLIEKLRVGDNADAEDLVADFLATTACVSSAINRNTIIAPYVFPTEPSSNAAPDPYAFLVDVGSFIPAGATSKVIPAYVGYNLIFHRNSIKHSTINTGGTYHSWDKITGTLTLLGGAATIGELFELEAN